MSLLFYLKKNIKYSIKEGLHRTLALLDMLKNKEFGNAIGSVKTRAIIGHRK